MAIVNSGILGNLKNLWLVKEQYYSTFFSVTRGYLTGIVSLTYPEVFYLNNGVDIGEILETFPEGQIVVIASLSNGKYLGALITNNIASTDDRWDYIPPFLNFRLGIYNSDNTLYKQIADEIGCVPKITMKATGEVIRFPVRLSLLFNNETKEASLTVVACSNYEPTNKKFNANTGFSWYRLGMTKTTLSEQYNFFVKDIKEYDADPWASAGYSGIGGGEGTFDFEGDTIALPSIPSVDAVSTGFLQLFSGGISKILELSQYMWSTDFFDNIVKITANPIDIIMGLYMYPFTVPVSGQKYVRAGNVITNISMGVPQSQIFEINCGNFPVPNFYGTYLDYEPFTKCEIFLPYCGTFPLSMDDIAGTTLNVRYRVDLLTGVCSAYVIVDGSVKYNYTGTCAINIPISSRSFENVYSAIIGVVGSMHGGDSFSLPSIGSVAGAVTSGKNQIQHGGNCSGNAGYLGVQKPYLIFTVPRVAIPKGLNTYTGYPIYATYKLSDLKGYTEVEEIHLQNMGEATQEEIDRILSLLKGGVIL